MSLSCSTFSGSIKIFAWFGLKYSGCISHVGQKRTDSWFYIHERIQIAASLCVVCFWVISAGHVPVILFETGHGESDHCFYQAYRQVLFNILVIKSEFSMNANFVLPVHALICGDRHKLFCSFYFWHCLLMLCVLDMCQTCCPPFPYPCPLPSIRYFFSAAQFLFIMSQHVFFLFLFFFSPAVFKCTVAA